MSLALATLFFYLYSLALPPSAGASKIVIIRDRVYIENVVALWNASLNAQTKTIVYCTDNRATIQ